MLAHDLYRPHPHIVSASKVESPSCISLQLTAVQEQLTIAQPGQFNMVTIFGYGDIPVSIAGMDEHQSIWHTVQSVGPTSHAFCQLRVGDIVGLRGPYGTPWPIAANSDESLIIITGGLGLAALKMAIENVVLGRTKVTRFIACIGARRPEYLPYWWELMRWKGALMGDSKREIRLIVDESGEEWGLPLGVTTDLLPESLQEPKGTKAFICGPEVMMKAAALRLIHLGVVPEKIFVSIERNMKCGFGGCGHCQVQADFVCRNGPIFAWSRIGDLLAIREL